MKRTAFTFLLAVVFITLLSSTALATDNKDFIKVNEPKDNIMISTDKIVVTGETVPKSSISVLVNGKAKANVPVGAAGIFLTQVPINSKENIITVKASYPSGSSQTVSRRVYQLEDNSKLPELKSLIQTLKTFLILK